MRKKDIQVSFFSFQDIVTSLSGVMIIIVLVLALQLVDQTTNAIKRANPEYEKLIHESEEARNRLATAQSEIVPSEWEEAFQPFFGLSTQELKDILKMDQQVVEEQTKKLEGIRQRCENLSKLIQEELVKVDEARQERDSSQAKLTEVEIRNQSLKDELQMHREEEEQLSQKLEETTKKLSFAFRGINNLRPLLVECRNDGSFRAVEYPAQSHEVKEFQNLFTLCVWLRNYNAKEFYPVLLFRRGSLARSSEIQSAIKTISPKIQLGREPVADDEVVF